VLASVFVVVVYRELANPEPPLGELTLFPTWSILAGMLFYVLGSSYWGRCYAFAVLFFLGGVLLPLQLHAGPLVFGVLWTVALAAIGWHLRHLAARSEQGKP
jgi:hypothetical protein